MTTTQATLLRPARHDLASLSRRELDVLALMASGLSNAGIAGRLWLTERTVEAHISRIIVKLGIEVERHANRRVLAVLAYLAATA